MKVAEPTDITTWWRDDLVTFIVGCSFTFETALQDGGVSVAHIDQGVNVPMYKTNVRFQRSTEKTSSVDLRTSCADEY